MKNALLLAGMMLATSVAQAKTYCSLASGGSKTGSYEQNLFYGEVSKPLYLVVNKGKTKATQAANMESILGKGAMNGDIIVTFSKQVSGYGITISHLDFSQSENVLPLDAMALGSVGRNSPLVLFVPPMDLSATCYSLE